MSRTTVALHFFLVTCLITLSLSGCKKEEIPGPQGDPGTPGGGGTSSVTSTGIFPLPAQQWVGDTVAKVWKATVNTSLITKSVVEKGGVKMFIKVNDYWWELPYYIAENIFQFGFEEGKVHLKISNIHEDMPPKPLTEDYRILIIS